MSWASKMTELVKAFAAKSLIPQNPNGRWIECSPASCLQAHQNRASDPITDGCEPPCGCWELNLRPLEE